MANVVIGLSALPSARGQFAAESGTFVQFPLPENFDEGLIDTAIRDTELLKGILVANKSKFRDMSNHLSAGRTGDAAKIAKAIGIEETMFVKNGGGVWVLVAAIAIAAAILLASDSPTPPAQPSGGANAGSG